MILAKRPSCCHFWKRSWMTLLATPNQVRCTAFHWQPVHNTYQIPFTIARVSAGGRPGPRCAGGLGNRRLILRHKGRGTMAVAKSGGVAVDGHRACKKDTFLGMI